jgi:hypothetical protein
MSDPLKIMTERTDNVCAEYSAFLAVLFVMAEEIQGQVAAE